MANVLKLMSFSIIPIELSCVSSSKGTLFTFKEGRVIEKKLQMVTEIKLPIKKKYSEGPKEECCG